MKHTHPFQCDLYKNESRRYDAHSHLDMSSTCVLPVLRTLFQKLPLCVVLNSACSPQFSLYVRETKRDGASIIYSVSVILASRRVFLLWAQVCLGVVYFFGDSFCQKVQCMTCICVGKTQAASQWLSHPRLLSALQNESMSPLLLALHNDRAQGNPCS